MGDSCVFDCTTADARTKRNAIDKIRKTGLKALLHLACTLSIRSHLMMNATKKNNLFTFRKHGCTLIAIGFGDLKRRQVWTRCQCIGFAFPCKTLHKMKKAIVSEAPQPDWARTLVALP